MNEELYKKLEGNTNLVNFVNKILTYNAIFENEAARNMLFVSLVSSDNLIDEDACDETIETVQFILNNIDLFVLSNDTKTQIIGYCKNAIKISTQNKNSFVIKKLKINNNEIIIGNNSSIQKN